MGDERISAGRTPDGDSAVTGSTDGISRRAALASAVGLTASTSGCVRQLRSIVNRDDIQQLSLTITTRSADGDRESIRLAREIAATLETVGIDVSIEMRSNEEFLRAVLINHDFDLYVGQHPGGIDPDFLYETLHSLYADESGWQNPFGFTNLLIDDRLEAQRVADGDERREAVVAMLEAIAIEQPFVPICTPTEYRLVRDDRYDGWSRGHLATRTGYLDLEPQTDNSADRLRVVHMDPRPSENLNPLNAEYREQGTFIDLLYDSLAVEVVAADGDHALEPWLAEGWEWTDESTLRLALRSDCAFHDGEPVTADDVAFTYRFLEDTVLGADAFPAPTPRYRGRVAAVDDIDVRDETTLEITVGTGQAVGEQALTVPILPEHRWSSRATAATVPGVRIAQGTTEAVVTDNIPPIGSGPFQYDSHSDRDYVLFERFDDHFTRRGSVDLPEPTVEELRIGIDPRSTSAIQLLEDDSADVTSSPLESYVIEDIEETDAVRPLESPSWTFYHLGFNARSAPFGNPRFRQVIAQLIDKAWLVDEVFHGHATPIATPVTDEWTPDDLAWDGADPKMPFLGSNGEVDVDTARTAFEEAGFRYDADGKLRVRQ
ncbi:ABC transporter substrate-binding protein [Natronorubrum thiooxidans]|uniref:Peptide/nickel transport system substrate-binding protein n=1 Tax=Natronorubrum thiooxidans TaxID=308853 RepID=A0A1N7D7F7_9EURY|nr:ABC transporter substrate-binding protein [Natronorubrum thiooxidans]SIR71687.1 peptide/nickel transport system substrate-binding protein [Natronorubrum thiooxidans]